MNIAKKKFLGATLAVTVLLGAGGTAAATAAPTPQSNIQTTISATSVPAANVVVSSNSSVSSIASAASVMGVSATSQGTTTNSQQAGALVRAAAMALVNAVKKMGPAAWNAMVNAAKGTVQGFKNWVNSLPSWVKGLVGGISGNALYDAIRAILGL